MFDRDVPFAFCEPLFAVSICTIIPVIKYLLSAAPCVLFRFAYHSPLFLPLKSSIREKRCLNFSPFLFLVLHTFFYCNNAPSFHIKQRY